MILLSLSRAYLTVTIKPPETAALAQASCRSFPELPADFLYARQVGVQLNVGFLSVG